MTDKTPTLLSLFVHWHENERVPTRPYSTVSMFRERYDAFEAGFAMATALVNVEWQNKLKEEKRK